MKTMEKKKKIKRTEVGLREVWRSLPSSPFSFSSVRGEGRTSFSPWRLEETIFKRNRILKISLYLEIDGSSLGNDHGIKKREEKEARRETT